MSESPAPPAALRLDPLGQPHELDSNAATTGVLLEVLHERSRQRLIHNRDVDHDDQLSRPEWAWLLSRRSLDLSCPLDAALPDVRRMLVEIAAVSVAAIEALDRNGGAFPPTPS